MSVYGEDEAALELAARYYRALPIDDPGYEQVTLSLPVARTALIGMHCWNIGCSDGPPVDVDYCVGMGWPQSTEEAWRIMVEVIRPAMDAARRIGLRVCHVETDWMDGQYPQIESRRAPEPSRLHPHQQEMLDRAHGADYMTRSPLAQMRRAELVSPQGDEPLVFYSDVLDEYLKAHGVDTLIYTGFAADMCLLGAEGGARAMLSRGYRCVVVRDGTIGVETPESFPHRLATNYALHIFEWSLGFGCSFEQFQRAVTGAEGGAS
jgi:nicotinamidase-related amidase